MANLPFTGRSKELKALKKLRKKKTASLVVIYGRRRIGKSRLAIEFGKQSNFYRISGIPETKNTAAQSQCENFARQVRQLSSSRLEFVRKFNSKLILLIQSDDEHDPSERPEIKLFVS